MNRDDESDWDTSKWITMKDAGFISFTCSQSCHKFTFFMKQCTHPLNYEARWKKLWKAMCCEWSLNDFSTWLLFVLQEKVRMLQFTANTFYFSFVVRFHFCFFDAPREWNAIFNRIINSWDLWRSGLRLTAKNYGERANIQKCHLSFEHFVNYQIMLHNCTTKKLCTKPQFYYFINCFALTWQETNYNRGKQTRSQKLKTVYNKILS